MDASTNIKTSTLTASDITLTQPAVVDPGNLTRISCSHGLNESACNILDNVKLKSAPKEEPQKESKDWKKIWHKKYVPASEFIKDTAKVLLGASITVNLLPTNLLCLGLTKIFTGKAKSIIGLAKDTLKNTDQAGHTLAMAKDIGTISEAADIYVAICDEMPNMGGIATADTTKDVGDLLDKKTNDIKGYNNLGRILANPELLSDIKDTELKTRLNTLSNNLKTAGYKIDATNGLITDNTGLKSCFYMNKDTKKIHLVLVGSGTDINPLKKGFYRTCATWLSNVLQGAGALPPIYRSTDFMTHMMKDTLGESLGENFVVSGHSLGGGLAQYAGTRNKLQTYAFNPSGLSMFTATRLDKKVSNKYVKCISMEEESLSQRIEGEGRLYNVERMGAKYVIKVPKEEKQGNAITRLMKRVKRHNMKPIGKHLRNLKTELAETFVAMPGMEGTSNKQT